MLDCQECWDAIPWTISQKYSVCLIWVPGHNDVGETNIANSDRFILGEETTKVQPFLRTGNYAIPLNSSKALSPHIPSLRNQIATLYLCICYWPLKDQSLSQRTSVNELFTVYYIHMFLLPVETFFIYLILIKIIFFLCSLNFKLISL